MQIAGVSATPYGAKTQPREKMGTARWLSLFFPGHPIFSVDRNAWVAAGGLTQGERVGTLDGTAIVASVEDLPATETVYSLEVHREHTFFVSTARVWGHDDCEIPPFTATMHAIAEPIARGSNIRKVNALVAKSGGARRGWRKMKTWTDDGLEIHYYGHHGIGRKGEKWAGDPDPSWT